MLLHWSRIAAKPLYAPHVNTVSDRLGFCELGCEQLSVLTVLHAVVGSGRIFFWRFCSCGWFLQTALRFLIDPLILPYNGVLHGSCFANWKSLFLNIQIFLFVLFRVLNYSRSCLVISSEFVRNSFNFLFFIFFLIFLEIKCCCLSHFTLEFGTENEGNAGWKLGCLCQTAWSCLCLHYHVLTF